MEQAQPEENAEFLLAAARQAGFQITVAQLHRWQREGLIPRPRQRGLGRARGSESLYPAGAARQVVRLCELRRHHRSLRAAAWPLWWEGFRIPESQVRKWFSQQLAVLDFFSAELRASADRPDSDDARDFPLVDELKDGRITDPVVSRMRSRTGRAAFPTLVHILLKTGSGVVDRMQDDDAAIVERGMRLDPGDAEVLLPRIASTMEPIRLRQVLESSALADLEAARDELRAVVEQLDALGAGLSAVVGPVLDRTFLSRLREREFAVGLLLVWLPLRATPIVKSGFDLFLVSLQAVAAGANPIKVISDFDAQLKQLKGPTDG